MEQKIGMLKLNTRYEILTPGGFGGFSGVQKLTANSRVKFKTPIDGKFFICSTNHKVKRFYPTSGEVSWVESAYLNAGDHIMTEFGPQPILEIQLEQGSFELYDLMDTPGNRYFSGGILSHNCEFLGSTNTLISPEKLRAFAWKPPRKDNWSVDVYEDPIPTSSYVICADTSHGVGLDYSAFTVIDVTQFPYRLVAKFHSNTASPIYFPEVIARTGRLYNNAYVLAETNDIGQAMVDALFRDLEYENVFTTTMKGRAGQKLGAGFGGARSILGVKMTKQVKFMGCSNIKDIIETDKLLIQDFDIIQEFFTFISRKNSYEAEEGCHDDLVMTLVLFGWLVRQPMFRDLTNNDIRAKLAEERYANLMDDLLPAGFVDTGDEIENLERPLRDEDAWL